MRRTVVVLGRLAADEARLAAARAQSAGAGEVGPETGPGSDAGEIEMTKAQALHTDSGLRPERTQSME